MKPNPKPTVRTVRITAEAMRRAHANMLDGMKMILWRSWYYTKREYYSTWIADGHKRRTFNARGA